MTDQDDLLRRAAHALPGGLLGNHRSGAGLEFVVKEGRGAYLWDMNGRHYLDYLLGSGPMLLGHAHPAVVEAVERQVRRGTSYMLLNEPAIELAEEVVRAVPCAEQVRYTSSGTEATFFALRVARAFRGRDKIMKFEGGFHGTHDYGMMSVSPRSPKAFPAPTPDSAGIPPALEGDVLVAPYNDLATAEALIATHHDALQGTAEYVRQDGTFNGNAIACAAGLATLAELRTPGTCARLHRTGARLRDGLAAAVLKHGVAARVSGEPPVFDIVFTDRPVVDYRATLTADRERIKRFNAELLRRGVVKAVNKIYVSLAHTDTDVDETIDVFDRALPVIAESPCPARRTPNQGRGLHGSQPSPRPEARRRRARRDGRPTVAYARPAPEAWRAPRAPPLGPAALRSSPDHLLQDPHRIELHPPPAAQAQSGAQRDPRPGS